MSEGKTVRYAAEAGGFSSSAAPAVHTPSDVDRAVDQLSEHVEQIYDNARDAGMYQFVEEVWAIDEHHTELTEDIRKLADPKYVPLICKRAYLSPAGTEEVHSYFCIGKYIEFPQEGYEDQAVKLSHVPRGFPFPPDKIHCLRILWAPWDTRDPETGDYLNPTEYRNNTPPAVVEVDRWLLEQMCALRKFFDSGVRIESGVAGEGDSVTNLEFETDKIAEILEEQTRADQQRMDAARAEMRYRVRHNWRQFKDAIENNRMAAAPEPQRAFLDLGRKS